MDACGQRREHPSIPPGRSRAYKNSRLQGASAARRKSPPMVMSSQPPANAPPSAHAAANDVATQPSDPQWADIVQQLGAEIAGPLSAALDRIQDLISTGQIDRQGLRALRDSVSQARDAGMMGQQLARLTSGKLSLVRERLQLTQMLRGVLAQRSAETQARGIQVRQVFKSVEVLADGALLFGLLNALVDWAITSTHSAIDLRLDLSPWPPKARLLCRFAHRSLDLLDDPRAAVPPALNSLAWRLLEQTAITLGLLPLREDESGITTLTLEFPHTVGDATGLATPASASISAPLPPRQTREPSVAQPNLPNQPKPLAGSHLLILSANRELRSRIQLAVQHMGLIVDEVSDIGEAMEFCLEGLPHGIVFDSSQRGPDFEHLHEELMREVPEFCFIEVLPHEQQTQLSTATANGLARISRQHLADALPSVLMFELSRGH